MLAVVFFVLAVLGLLATLVAIRPPGRPQWLANLTFLPSLSYGEWAPQWLAGYVVALAVVTPWALDHTWSRVGLVVALAAVLGLVLLTVWQVRAWLDRPGLQGPDLPRLQKLTGLAIRPRDVERMHNVEYTTHDDRRLHVDVYRRRDRPTGGPVLVQVHGGAWVLGRKEDQALPLMHLLARRGWVCVAVEYRLSPKAAFPAHLVDVKEGLAWARAHAREFGGDPTRIVITGGSAGGHLASLAALTPGLTQPGFENVDTSVAGCIAFYGVYDFTDRAGHWRGRGLDRLLAKRVMQVELAEARDRYDEASPMSALTAAAPPFLVVQGSADTLVPPPEAHAFAAALAATSGKPVTMLDVPHAQHAFDLIPSLRTRAVLQHVVAFCESVTKTARDPSGRDVQPA